MRGEVGPVAQFKLLLLMDWARSIILSGKFSLSLDPGSLVMKRLLCILFICCIAANLSGAADIVVAEGEKFVPIGSNGWAVTHMDDSYASHTYGGMWMSQGACLGAPVISSNAIATQTVTIAQSGDYRVWSKYQAPPYFTYLHRIEIVQSGVTNYSYDYGKLDAPRFWSFAGAYAMGPIAECWWPWGVDHDAAEAPTNTVYLNAGTAEIRLVTLQSVEPAGDRMVDFVLLTTDLTDDYDGWSPYGVGSPFCLEALAKTELYMRFRNTAGTAQQLQVQRAGHFQPNYSSATTNIPASSVAAGQWSSWVNIGPFCRLVHNEGLTLTLSGALADIEVQFARQSDGSDLVGDLSLPSGETLNVPIGITWDTNATVQASADLGAEITAMTNQWRTANNAAKPTNILFYGDFRGVGTWIDDMKDALGYNTLLPDGYDHVQRDGLHAHSSSEAAISAYAGTLSAQEKLDFQVLSFGDEISLGSIDYGDPNNLTNFRAWLVTNGVTSSDLGGIDPGVAMLTKTGTPHEIWYSDMFDHEERFDKYKSMTELAETEIGSHVLCGANYSPHKLALYYGPIYQWVDIFKHNGMSLYWTEDYIFSVPEVPQIVSWMFATMRCAVKYNNQPMHFYMMPHAPGQVPGFLRRNTLLGIGYGAKHINNFWVGPQKQFTENYVAWGYDDMFQTIHEAIYDTAEAEPYQIGGTLRPASVAVVLSKATDFNESLLMIDKTNDIFTTRCENAPTMVNQIICRKDQQMLYLALRHAGHAVDLITEDDIKDGILTNYASVYFAGEWIDKRATTNLAAWVSNGGTLYATAGCGRMDQFGDVDTEMQTLLGISGSTVSKNVAVIRTLLELPLMPAIGTITFGGSQVDAIGMRQEFTTTTATVLGTWENGAAAVTVNSYGSGKAFAVGTLAGNTYMKTGLRVEPWARGGRKMVYNPVDFDSSATALVRLGVDTANIQEDVVCSSTFVEAAVIDSDKGTLVTLINWTNMKLTNLSVTVKLAAAPEEVRSVEQNSTLPMTYANGAVTFATDLADADYFLIPKKVGGAPFPYVPGEAFHIMPSTHNMESGYFSLCEGLNKKIYIGTAAYGTNGFLVEFDPETEQQRIVIDTMALCGLTATGYAAQAKIHTRNFVGESGTIYVGSKQGIPDAQTYPGGYLMSYDPSGDIATNYGMPMTNEGIIDVVADESRGLIYIVTCEEQHWMTYDMNTRAFQELGPTGVSYATTLIDQRGIASMLTDDFELAQYNADTSNMTVRPIEVDGILFTNSGPSAIPTWNLNPDKSTAYLILMNDPTLIEIDLLSTGAVVTAQSHGTMLNGPNPDCRSGMFVAPDGKVLAVIRVDNDTGYTAGGGQHYLHHLVSFNPHTTNMTDMGVLTIENHDFYPFGGSPNVEPSWAHGIEELPDGTYTVRYNHMGLIVADDGTIYITIIYPFSLLKINGASLQIPDTVNATISDHGTISPAGVFEHSGSQAFLISADAYYHVSAITTNNSPTTPITATNQSLVFMWDSILGNATIHATTSETLTIHDTPLWWLALHGMTNDTFDIEAAKDEDLDGLLNWEEYHAGTDPTNLSSLLSFESVCQEGVGLVIEWQSASNRFYSIDRVTNLISSQVIRIATNLPSTPPSNVHTANLSGVKAYYRIKVYK